LQLPDAGETQPSGDNLDDREGNGTKKVGMSQIMLTSQHHPRGWSYSLRSSEVTHRRDATVGRDVPVERLYKVSLMVRVCGRW